MRYLLTVVILTLTFMSLSAQYRWDWRDPLDLGAVDWGDNKLLAYNGIGVGLSLYFTQADSGDRRSDEVSFSSYVDVIREYSRPPKSDVLIERLRWTKQIRRFLAIGGDLSLYQVFDSQVSTQGVGAQIVFTWHIYQAPHWLLYFDNGVGPNLFIDPFPYGGTRFNFTTFYGVYVAYCLPSAGWINLGLKNIHISNADIKGRDRNPALDGWGVSLGYRFF